MQVSSKYSRKVYNVIESAKFTIILIYVSYLFLLNHGIVRLSKDGRLELIIDNQRFVRGMWLNAAAFPASGKYIQVFIK